MLTGPSSLQINDDQAYPITLHISTCAYSKANENLVIFHCEKATDISTCAYVQPSL